MTDALLEVRGLSIALPKGADRALAVEGASFDLKTAEILCLVGESGSGKSALAGALMGVPPRGLRIVSGSIRFGGRELATLSERDWRALRGRDLAMVPQEPLLSLNPSMTIGAQIAEALELHLGLAGPERRARVLDLLSQMRIEDPARVAESYPHRVSGGQRQRALIAMATACAPRILIADEATASLDASNVAQSLELIRATARRHGQSILFITHDIDVVARIADRVAVLEAGRIVEIGDAQAILSSPAHETTKRLLAARQPGPPGLNRPKDAPAILSLTALTKRFAGRAAVDAVSFDLARGEVLGVVGDSGSGKTTLARLIAGLAAPDGGAIRLAADPMRRAVQMVFQDPSSSLNPRRRIGAMLARAAELAGRPLEQARARAAELLELVGIGADRAAARFPGAFSGGERQRIAIARALAMDPEVLVADECVSALDAVMRVQILDLLDQLRRRFGLSMIFITHDLRAAARISDRIAVMSQGRIVEIATTERIFSRPQHPDTRRLVAESGIVI